MALKDDVIKSLRECADELETDGVSMTVGECAPGNESIMIKPGKWLKFSGWQVLIPPEQG